MKLNNKTIIELAKLNVISKEKLAYNAITPDEDIVYEENNSITNENNKYKVNLDNITDEDLPLMIMTEQLKTLKTIKKGVTFFVVLSIISIIISIIGAVNIASLF